MPGPRGPGEGAPQHPAHPEREAGEAAFARLLTLEDRVLVDVRDQLYGGDWDELERDLRARLTGRPFVFKLTTRIEEDLERIEKIRRFEAERGVNVREVLDRNEDGRAGDLEVS